MKSTIFWDIASCSPLKVNRRFGRTYRLHLHGRICRARYQCDSRWQAEFHLLSHWYLARLIRPWRRRCYSETSVDFQRTTRRYIPEDSTLHNHCCENLKTYNLIIVHYRAIGLFWTLSFVLYVEDKRAQRFGDWICLRPQVDGAG
jgi:hypothetical protein